MNPARQSNLRSRIIPLQADSIILDSLSILPSSFFIKDIDASAYDIDFVNAILYWKTKPKTDSVYLGYRVFPYRLSALVQRWSFDSIANKVSVAPFLFKNRIEGQQAEPGFGNIRYNGSFGRALSFGNKQDAVVNSNFQLQLNGLLGDSIEITAALTDNNIPIQPDGTTQQLNEFDQVFLQFKKSNWQLDLGDIDIRQTEMYFLNFYKRLQGISYQVASRISPSVQSRSLVSGSIAKGKFNRNIVQGLEGNQGPYRLTGANKELFFIVLANTERVFLDGELLRRGEDQDYVINYNTAEVSFMPRRMITKDSRIQIEFEYADRNYLNSNLHVFQEFSVNNKLKVKLGAFSNSDAKNSQINQVLDNRQKQFLFNVGDSIGKAFYPSVNLDSFAAGKVLYEKIYYTNNALLDSFYKYSSDPASARYALSFTDMGQGNGNYIADMNGANGKVYRFVPAVNGLRQGRYEPVSILATPKKQQLFSLASEYSFNDRNSVKADIALSNYDVNTFSSKHAGDDQGIAAKFRFTNTTAPGKGNIEFSSSIDYEHVGQKFRPIERLRVIEFSREWGLPIMLPSAEENILRLATGFKTKRDRSLSYQFTTYQRSDNYQGLQNLVQYAASVAGWALNGQLANTSFTGSYGKGNYFRPVIDMSKVLKQLSSMRLGFRYALENNEIRSKGADSLSNASFSFDTYSAYLKTDESRKNKYGISFFTRSDKHPFRNKLSQADRSYNINLQAELAKSSRQQLVLNTTYRILRVYNQLISPQKQDRTLLGRAEYQVNEWNGFMTGNVLYELGTGQEQKKDFAYIEVPAGQGEFTWIDYNNDGTQQLNEFERALFTDQAKFIRVFTPTNQFSKANYTTLNYTLNLNPKALFDPGSAAAKFISKISFQSTLQKTKKALAKGDVELNPFKYSVLDTALLTNTTSMLNTLSFNRHSSAWGIDLGNLFNAGKALLTYGYETRQMNDWNLKARWNISPVVLFDFAGRYGRNGLYTPNFINRNYELAHASVEPRLSFVRGTTFRLQAGYKAEKKQNKAIFGGEESFANAVSLETRYNVVQNSTVSGRFSYSNIRFSKPDVFIRNPNVEYIMMDALQPGNNYLWGLDFTKKLMNNMEINFQYEGRKPGEMNPIHTGRAAIRALF